MSRALTERWQQDVARALALPDMKDRIAMLAGEPGGEKSEEFAAYIREQLERMGKLAKEVGLKPRANAAML